HDSCRASAHRPATGPTYPSARTVPAAGYPWGGGTTAVRCSPSPSASTPLKVDRSVDLHEREAAPSVPKRVTPSSSPRQLRSQDSVVSASTEGAHAPSTRRQAVARACPSASSIDPTATGPSPVSQMPWTSEPWPSGKESSPSSLVHSKPSGDAQISARRGTSPALPCSVSSAMSQPSAVAASAV